MYDDAQTYTLVSELADGNGLIKSLHHIIAEGNTPHSSLQRMMLWSDATKIWQERPFIGHGLNWYNKWNERTYKEAYHSLLHNGYLEIAIRYGLAGLLFYAWLYLWSIKQSLSAARANLISNEAAQCHSVILLYFAWNHAQQFKYPSCSWQKFYVACSRFWLLLLLSSPTRRFGKTAKLSMSKSVRSFT